MNIENNEIYDVCLFAELVAKNSNKILFINCKVEDYKYNNICLHEFTNIDNFYKHIINYLKQTYLPSIFFKVAINYNSNQIIIDICGDTVEIYNITNINSINEEELYNYIKTNW